MLTTKKETTRKEITDGHNQLLEKSKEEEKFKKQMRRKKTYECTAVEITECWNVTVQYYMHT